MSSFCQTDYFHATSVDIQLSLSVRILTPLLLHRLIHMIGPCYRTWYQTREPCSRQHRPYHRLSRTTSCSRCHSRIFAVAIWQGQVGIGSPRRIRRYLRDESVIDMGVLDANKYLEDRRLEGGDSCPVSDIVVCVTMVQPSRSVAMLLLDHARTPADETLPFPRVIPTELPLNPINWHESSS